MNNKQLDLVIPLDKGLPELLASFQNNFYVNVLPETVIHRIYYDTFDWLLYNNGAVLEVHEEGESRRIYWQANQQSSLRIQLGLSDVPQLASELPDSDFRRQLQSVISVRELTPRIKIKVKRLPLVMLDKHEKVVVRVNFDEHWYYPSKTRAGTVLGKRIAIKPVKGYQDEFGQVEAFFEPMRLREAQDNLIKLALLESGYSASEYSNKLNLILDPEMPAEQAMKQILLRLLEIMQQNTAGSIRGRDSEFMHDFRVSIRKTRSALTQITRVLPQGTIIRFNQFFSGLGKLTNPIRDGDVFLLKLESYQQCLKPSSQEHLKPLREYLVTSRATAQKKFVETLKTQEHRDQIKEWREYLENADPTEPPLENSGRPVYKLADELIWNMYQLALEEGNAITDETEAEALHELRKTCKKLRYLMEFFQSLYPARDIRELIRAMKGLQDNLGVFNDLHVHAGILKKFIKQSPDSRAKKACKQIVNELKRRQVKTRGKFAERYAAFSSGETQKEFRELFVDSRKG
ncbi:MAG: CHAD domain-containing protein [Thiotrichales bacterium]|nr:MAG: CHAD domain-containing protein [Thiotrichales bacterium]